MNNKDYLAWAITKDRPTYQDMIERVQKAPGQARVLHAALGIAGESGELVDAIKKHVMYGKDLDIANVKEELGDMLWYMSLLLDAIGSSYEEVMQINHDKLEKRFPSGFTEKAAVARADKHIKL